MTKNDAMFLNVRNEPIKDLWVNKTVLKLARRAGIQQILSGYELVTRYKKGSHELRDLLKSTLIDAGTRIDIADHVVGHKPKDSYEKQAQLYPLTLRSEYMKASKKLNIFSATDWLATSLNR